MAGTNNRISRINEEISKILSAILTTVKDPRVRDAGMITITHVDTAGDLSAAKVFVSLLVTPGDDESTERQKELMKGLRSSAGYMRRELSAQLALRATPELIFLFDSSIDRGAKIIEMMNHLQ